MTQKTIILKRIVMTIEKRGKYMNRNEKLRRIAVEVNYGSKT
jgi:hypothetical protein